MRTAALLLAGGAAPCAGHSSMVHPMSRNGGKLKDAGCPNYQPASCMQAASWFTTPTTTKVVTTTTPGLRTVTFAPFHAGRHPWHAPGTAPINSPCGQLGTVGPEGGGKDGRDLKPAKREVWQRGGTAKVAWAVYQNHGGGYSYRLCPASTKPLTEECFQAHHLQFADSATTVMSQKNQTIATLKARGTTIDGREWRMNPIPNDEGGAPFGAPCSGCKGGNNPFSLVDTVVVPDVPPADYVLSWRWDCEVTAQVWANCGDITIAGGSGPAPAPAPAPKPPQPPAPAPVTTYGCVNNACVADAAGVPKDTCVAVCHQ